MSVAKGLQPAQSGRGSLKSAMQSLCYNGHHPLLNLVEQLVFAEGQAMRRVPMHMRDRGTAKRGEWVAFKTGKRESRVARPARAMQTRFGEATIPMAEQAHTLHRNIQNRRRIRDLLLPCLLSGQVNIKEN